MRYLLILAALTLLIPLQSQVPVPRPTKIEQDHESESRSAQQQTAYPQQGTLQSPFVVQLIPAPQNQEEADRDANERIQHAANDKRLTRFTGELVFATILLGLVGILQLIVFGIQAIQLRRTVEATKKNAEVLIASERAWMDATFVRISLPDGADRYQLKITNHGRTPAHFLSYMVGTLHNLSHSREPKADDYIRQWILPYGTLAGADYAQQMEQPIIEPETGKNTVYHVVLRYFDLVTVNSGGPIHETSFTCVYLFEQRKLDRIPADNRYT
jgi:hypothetical protein